MIRPPGICADFFLLQEHTSCSLMTPNSEPFPADSALACPVSVCLSIYLGSISPLTSTYEHPSHPSRFCSYFKILPWPHFWKLNLSNLFQQNFLYTVSQNVLYFSYIGPHISFSLLEHTTLNGRRFWLDLHISASKLEHSALLEIPVIINTNKWTASGSFAKVVIKYCAW